MGHRDRRLLREVNKLHRLWGARSQSMADVFSRYKARERAREDERAFCLRREPDPGTLDEAVFREVRKMGLLPPDLREELYRRARVRARWALQQGFGRAVCARFAVESVSEFPLLREMLGGEVPGTYRNGKASDGSQELSDKVWEVACREQRGRSVTDVSASVDDDFGSKDTPWRYGVCTRLTLNGVLHLATVASTQVPDDATVVLVEAGRIEAEALSRCFPRSSVHLVGTGMCLALQRDALVLAGGGPKVKGDLAVVNVPPVRSWDIMVAIVGENAQGGEVHLANRRRPDGEEQARLVRRILDVALEYLKPGGRVVLAGDEASGAHDLAVQYLRDMDLIAPSPVRGGLDTSERAVYLQVSDEGYRAPGLLRVPEPTSRLMSIWNVRRRRMTPAPEDEVVATILRAQLNGDELGWIEGVCVHKGHPESKDTEGLSKAQVYDRLTREGAFRVARDFGMETRRGARLPRSRRVHVRKEGGGVRPIDVPAEKKRPYAAMLALQLARAAEARSFLPHWLVGFRKLADVSTWGAQKGRTIQDEYAAKVYSLAGQSPWAVSVDLKDAFGLLSRKAIDAALEALGLNHGERRKVWEAARINTVLPSGRNLRHRLYGVEQGNPLGPLLFNIVMAFLDGQVRRRCPRAWLVAFGDDIVLLGRVEEEARGAFEVLVEEARALDMRNVRPLNTSDTKASVLYDLRTESVPLIKTYLVSVDGIGLQAHRHEEALEKVGSAKATPKRLRRASNCTVISKKWIQDQAGSGGDAGPPDGDDSGRGRAAAADSPHPHVGDPKGSGVEGTSRAPAHEGREHDPDRHSPPAHPRSVVGDGSVRVHVHGVDAHTPCRGDVGNGPVGVHAPSVPGEANCALRAPVLDNPVSTNTAPAAASTEVVVSRSHEEGDAMFSRGPGSSGKRAGGRLTVPRAHIVLRSHPELIRRACGGPLKVGNTLKGRVLDFVGADLAGLRAEELGLVLRRLVRAVRIRRAVFLRWVPGDPDFDRVLRECFAGWDLTRRGDDGGVFVRAHLPLRRRREPPPPNADVVVTRVRPDSRALRTWQVVTRADGRPRTRRFEVSSTGYGVGRAEALVAALEGTSAGSVAVRTSWLAGVLTGRTSGPRSVGLYRCWQAIRARWAIEDTAGPWTLLVDAGALTRTECGVAS